MFDFLSTISFNATRNCWIRTQYIIGFKRELEHAVKTSVKEAKYAEFTEVMTNVDTRSREAIKGK